MSALTNFVTSVTEQDFFPVVVDNFYEGNALFMRLFPKKKMWSSGYQLVIPTEIAGRTSLGSYNGGDVFTTSQEDVRKQFLVNPSQYYANVTISGIQMAANRGKRAVVDLMTAEFNSVSRALKDKMGDDLYGDGTGNSSKAINGLVYHVDDGTTVATFQNLSRTTYPTLKATVTTGTGALTLAHLASDFDAAQVGSDAPTIGLTSPATFSIIEALYMATSRYQLVQNTGRVSLTAAGIENAGHTANAGFTGLMFRGLPIISDDKTPAGELFLLNEKYLDLYEMQPSSETAAATREGFAWTGWKKPTNQDVIISQFLWYGQLVGTEPRKHSRRTGITS